MKANEEMIIINMKHSLECEVAILTDVYLIPGRHVRLCHQVVLIEAQDCTPCEWTMLDVVLPKQLLLRKCAGLQHRCEVMVPVVPSPRPTGGVDSGRKHLARKLKRNTQKKRDKKRNKGYYGKNGG